MKTFISDVYKRQALKQLYEYKIVYTKNNPLETPAKIDGKAVDALMELYNDLVALRDKKKLKTKDDW